MSNASLRHHPFIIGIGASAGGLEALEAFFDEFPPDSGAALIVIQHLSPDFKSLMGELLSRRTKMNIIRVEDREPIRPDTVYLISPNKNIQVSGYYLVASSIEPGRHLRHPIDHFLLTLAQEHQERAIAVILSGTGSDGTKGAIAVKKQGGYVIAQEPDSCRFDGMPVNVIKSGCVDQVLHPEQIPDAISRHMNFGPHQQEDFAINANDRSFQHILELLRGFAGVDFSRYRPSTVTRRIERRLQLSQVNSLDEYVDKLKNDRLELKELHSELLIGVTKFFRDAEAFEELQNKIIPNILQQATNRTIRVWCAGCSTGEEAYSIAILFHEAYEQINSKPDIKMFATDVDKDAINIASHGVYPEPIVSEIDPIILNKYFTKKEGAYQVQNSIRSSIIFSQHNVTKDPPFTNLDLISCRNLLIYFQPRLQSKVLSLLHFGLRQHGHLFLGKSEALGDLSREFEIINPTLKIFSKLRDVKLSLVTDLDISDSGLRFPYQTRVKRQQSVKLPTNIPRETHMSTVYEDLLNEYVPPSILIDEQFNLIHTFGNSYEILDVPKGRSTLDVQKMLPKELAIALSMAVTNAKSSNQDTLFTDIMVHRENVQKVFNIKVKPFEVQKHIQDQSFLVSFEELETTRSEPAKPRDIKIQSYDAHKHYLEKIKQMEEQLNITKESLQSTIEELETTNEELQSTNEELMSSNEELHSSNEELHSVNEELYTVNSEYQAKIEELTTANNDLDFLLRSINLGMIFLDKKLKIRRYNEDVKKFINLMSHDIGRPITDIKFSYMQEEITAAIHRVQDSGESEYLSLIIGKSEYLINAIPYYTPDPKFVASVSNGLQSGIVLTFLDMTKMNEAIQRVQNVKS
ncbi:MAG: CheR family methyltransferase [Oligoflexus sp.]